jgi:hypothetical protein
MSRAMEAVGIALRQEFLRWWMLWCLLVGRADPRVRTVLCFQWVVVRWDK